MFRSFIFVFFCSMTFGLCAQTIPSYRLFDWSTAGNTDYDSTHNQLINVLNVGASGTGLIADDSAIQVAIDSLAKGSGGIVFIPQGIYKITKKINLKSNIVLRGEGSDKTILRCDLGGVDDCIKALGNESSTIVNLVGNHTAGSIELNIGTHSYQAGDWIRVLQSDSSFINDSWSTNFVGQIVQIDSVKSNKLYIHEPLRIFSSSSQTPRVRLVTPIKSCGLEDFRIVRNDATSAQTGNIDFTSVVNGWIYGVESDSCNFSHVILEKSAHVVVRGCYFRNAHSYGGGGEGYGVVMQFTSTQNLVVDNIFQHLRHSVLLQACPNGNVVGYNYSTQPYWTESFVPSDYAGDIVLHGNYPFANLFEGNIFNNLRPDYSHGINGPHNAFIRNRFTNFGIIFSTSAADSQTIVGNEITGAGSVTLFGFLVFNRGQYAITGSGHFEYNNNRNGTILPSGTTGTIANSLYLGSQPDFWVNSGTWPTLGGSNTINTGTNPAEYRFNNITLKTTPLGMGTALPVNLIHFSGRRVDDRVLLTWETAQEINNDFFTVKKLTGSTFKDIANLPGSGNSLTNKQYEFEDIEVDLQETGFYQLFQTDFDGSTRLVGQLVVKSVKSNFAEVYPNPVSNLIYVKFPPVKSLKIWNITDQQGNIVLKGAALEETVSIDLSRLQVGLYQLELLFSDTTSEIHRIVKINP